MVVEGEAVDLGNLLPYHDGAPVDYVDLREDRPTTAQAWEVLYQDLDPCIHTITVDLDKGAELPRRKMDPALGQWYQRVSNDGAGTHLRLVLRKPCTAWQALQLRQDMGDDPNRVAYDLYRAASGKRQEAGGWLADGKAYYPAGATEERWGEAGVWSAVVEGTQP